MTSERTAADTKTSPFLDPQLQAAVIAKNMFLSCLHLPQAKELFFKLLFLWANVAKVLVVMSATQLAERS